MLAILMVFLVLAVCNAAAAADTSGNSTVVHAQNQTAGQLAGCNSTNTSSVHIVNANFNSSQSNTVKTDFIQINIFESHQMNFNSTNFSSVNTNVADQPSKVVISGKVTKCSTGEPFYGAAVAAEKDGTVLAKTTANEDGTYNLELWSNDKSFNVTASYPGHKSSSKEVNVSHDSNGTLRGSADFELGLDDVYVSPTGNDATGDGTAVNPYQTIGKGIKEVNPDGRVHLADGTYTGSGNRGLTIDKNVSIIGESWNGTVIDAESMDNIFTIQQGNIVKFQNLTFANGNIYDNGDLTVNNCTFTSIGGGIPGSWYSSRIFNKGNLTVDNCTFENNAMVGRGGVIYNEGNLTVNNSIFKGNYLVYGGGGTAIYNMGNSTVTNCDFAGNYASNGQGGTSLTEDGGAIWNSGHLNVIKCTFGGNGADYIGGAIYNEGILNVTDSTFTNNYAPSYGGGGAIFNIGDLTVTNCTFTGNSVLESTVSYGGGAIYNAGTLTVNKCTFTNNTVGWEGGGAIFTEGNAAVNNCNFTGNKSPFYGGAIINGGTLTINNCDFAGNGGSALVNRGMLTIMDCTFTGNSGYEGGAIFNYGNVVVHNSTFTGNKATYGGAIANGDYTYPAGTLTVADCTFIGNTASNDGGAIWHYNDPIYLFSGGNGTLTVDNCIFAGNTASNDGGAVYGYNGTMNITGSNFENNAANSGNGGAIWNHGGEVNSGYVNFNRIVGNSPGNSEVYGENGTFNAQFNWWGSNNGPSENISTGTGGVVLFDPWFVLNVTSDPATIFNIDNSTVTADLLHDSSGVYHDPSLGHVPDGIPVQFIATLGAIMGNGTILNGEATVIFVAGTNAGLATIQATVDNQTVIAPVEILSKDDVYVSPDGNDSTGEGTPTKPYQTIGKGVSEVNDGGRVHLENGTYHGPGNRGLTIDKNVSIIGESQNGTVIDAEGAGRIFSILPGNDVTIQNLTLKNGTPNEDLFSDNAGGAIYNSGNLTVDNCTFSGNHAHDGKSGSFDDLSSRGGDGGAIYNIGNLTITDCTFSGNCAGDGGSKKVDYDGPGGSGGFGGAIYNTGDLTVEDCTFSGNCAGDGGSKDIGYFGHGGDGGSGGAIYNAGNLTVAGCAFSDNYAGDGGFSYGMVSIGGDGGSGGAIYSTLISNITNCTFSGNHAGDCGGGQLGSDGGSGGAIYSSGDLIVDSCDFSGNHAGFGGSDFYMLSNDYGGSGGAIYSSTNLNIKNSTFSGNYAGNDFGGFINFAGSGGAIYNIGNLTVENCTFSGNYAGNGEYASSGGHGGAIYNTDNLTVDNCIFSGNRAGNGAYGSYSSFGGSGGSGGAINNRSALNIKDSTFIDNSAGDGGYVTDSGSGGAISNGGPLNITSSIFLGNHAGNGDYGGSGGAIYAINNLIVDKCIFSGNHAGNAYYGGPGGAIYTRGNLTADNCVFSGNSAGNDSFGSYNSYSSYGGAVYGYALNVKDCIFTNNTAYTGGAIYGTALNITGSNFENNTATSGNGSAIWNRGGTKGYVNFNRIVGNNPQNIEVYNEGETLDARYNWWGSNASPSEKVFGDVLYDPWLVLTINADPTTINNGDNSTITADLLHDSNGVYHDPALGHVPDGIPIILTTNWGSFNSPSITLGTVNGSVTAVFHADGGTPPLNPVQITASADNATVFAFITIIGAANPGGVINIIIGGNSSILDPNQSQTQNQGQTQTQTSIITNTNNLTNNNVNMVGNILL